MLTVKFLARTAAEQDPALWTSLLLKNGSRGNSGEGFGVRWTFDPDARSYDALVVYEDLPYPPGSRRSLRVERLACARANTLFVTTEPTSIKIYGRNYLRQFGQVLSRQPARVIDHPGHIQRTPPLRPYYGRRLVGKGRHPSVGELARHHPEKSAELSTVCSTKTMTPQLAARYTFVTEAARHLPLDVFGRGIRPIDEKSEAMDAYRYHIAIENHRAPGHWTEKISDAFLAECLPFYHGDPDIAAAFPADAVVPIDITQPREAITTIRATLAIDAYARRRPAILEAKRRVLEDHNLLKVCADILTERSTDAAPGGEVLGRHAFRKAHPLLAAADALRARRHADAL